MNPLRLILIFALFVAVLVNTARADSVSFNIHSLQVSAPGYQKNGTLDGAGGKLWEVWSNANGGKFRLFFLAEGMQSGQDTSYLWLAWMAAPPSSEPGQLVFQFKGDICVEDRCALGVDWSLKALLTGQGIAWDQGSIAALPTTLTATDGSTLRLAWSHNAVGDGRPINATIDSGAHSIQGILDPPGAPVPESGTLLLLGLGLALGARFLRPFALAQPTSPVL